MFDAKAARALASRTRTLHDCLADMKQAVSEASALGEYTAAVLLPESLPVRSGQSANNARFLSEFFKTLGHDAWCEAVNEATRSGYDVYPAWRSNERGAVVAGITLDWSLSLDPPQSIQPLALMAAHLAHRQAASAHGHERWVDARMDAVRKAASAGHTSVLLWDAAPIDDAAWPKRRDTLHRAGFKTELLRAERGAELVVSW